MPFQTIFSPGKRTVKNNESQLTESDSTEIKDVKHNFMNMQPFNYRGGVAMPLNGNQFACVIIRCKTILK